MVIGNLAFTAPFKGQRGVGYKASAEAVRADGGFLLTDRLFAFSLLIYPANALVAVGALGELGIEPYALINFFLVPFAWASISRRRQPIDSLFFVFSLCIGIVIIASGLANISEIAGAEFKGRTGLSRYISGSMVLLFGLYFSFLVSFYASLNFRKMIAIPILWGAVIVSFSGSLEFLSWFSPVLGGIYRPISQIFHANIPMASGTVGHRITSITAEPSNFGMYISLMIPWLWALGRKFDKKTYRILCLMTFIDILFLSLASGRTSFFGSFIILFILCMVILTFRSENSFRYMAPVVKLSYIVASVFPLLFIILYQDDIASWIKQGGSVSNASRTGTIVIQANMFMDNFLFGVGMGQYGYHVPGHVPLWANTWEFKKWMFDPKASFFPSFSIYTRIGAELGAFGYIVWVFFSYKLLVRTVMAAYRFSQVYGRFPYIGVAVICGFFGIIAIGWSAATYRVLNIWFTFGMAVAYISNPRLLEFDFLARVPAGAPTNQQAAVHGRKSGVLERRGT